MAVDRFAPRLKSSVSRRGAAGLALASFTAWVLADTGLKVLGASAMPGYEMLGLAGAAEALALVAHGAWRGEVSRLRPKGWAGPFLRSLLDLGNNLCVVLALRHLPLALFYILIFLAPLVTAVLAAGFLGEMLSWRKALALVVGFAGVVVAVNPFGMGRVGDLVGYGACAVCVLCFSANMIWSRRMTQTETPESLTLVSALVTVAAGVVLGATLRSAGAVSAGQGMLLGAIGMLWAAGSLWFFKALKHTAAANVAQYHYSQLVTGAAVAYAIWRERPTAWMMAGALLIVGAGWYVAVGGEVGARSDPAVDSDGR